MSETYFTEETLRFIDAAYWAQHSRNLQLQTPQGPIMVKGQRPARTQTLFWALDFISKVFFSAIIRPVPAYGGARSQDIEIRRLYELRAAGLPVPKVEHVAKDYLLLQTLEGRPLDSFVSNVGIESKEIFETGLTEIRNLHSAGQYLSQGFARNILVVEKKLWFIDFEDDPLEVLTLKQAQARDYFLYLLSLVWLNRAMFVAWQDSWQQFRKTLDPEIYTLLEDVFRKIAWMRHLPQKRKPLGRDLLQLQALAQFMDFP